MNGLLIFIVVTSIVAGQLLIKYSQHLLYSPANFSAFELGKTAVLNLTNPLFILSLFFTLIAGLSWLLVLQKMPLNRAYPFLSLNHFAIYFLSCLLFGEAISLTSCMGILSIGIGTILLGMK